MENLNAQELAQLNPVKVLSQNMTAIAQAIDEAASVGNKQQVLELVNTAEELLQAISKLNQ